MTVILVGSLQLLWQFAATGDPFLNLYTLWWEYDKVGFGPGYGRYGHTLNLARVNTEFSLQVGSRDLFGWAMYSWIFIPFGIFAARRNGAALLVGSVFISIVAVYTFYWIGSWLFGSILRGSVRTSGSGYSSEAHCLFQSNASMSLKNGSILPPASGSGPIE